jgi:hypothetical protein
VNVLHTCITNSDCCWSAMPAARLLTHHCLRCTVPRTQVGMTLLGWWSLHLTAASRSNPTWTAIRGLVRRFHMALRHGSCTTCRPPLQHLAHQVPQPAAAVAVQQLVLCPQPRCPCCVSCGCCTKAAATRPGCCGWPQLWHGQGSVTQRPRQLLRGYSHMPAPSGTCPGSPPVT